MYNIGAYYYLKNKLKYMNKNIEVYTSTTCHFCIDLKKWLDENNITYTEKVINSHPEIIEELKEKTGQLGVPVTIIEGEEEPIIGFNKAKMAEILGV